MFWSLMIHAITRVFNTFAFIYMLCKNYADLNINTKSINCYNSFWKSFQKSPSIKHLPLIANITFKKYIKRVLLLGPQIGEDSRVSRRAKKHYSTEYRPKKHGLALMLFKSMLMQYDRQISVVIFVVSGKFSENGGRYWAEWVC